MSIAEPTPPFSSKKVVSSSSKSAYGIGYLHSFMRQMVGACHTNTNHGEHALYSSFNHVWYYPSIVDFFNNVVVFKCWVYNLQDLIRMEAWRIYKDDRSKIVKLFCSCEILSPGRRDCKFCL